MIAALTPLFFNNIHRRRAKTIRACTYACSRHKRIIRNTYSYCFVLHPIYWHRNKYFIQNTTTKFSKHMSVTQREKICNKPTDQWSNVMRTKVKKSPGLPTLQLEKCSETTYWVWQFASETVTRTFLNNLTPAKPKAVQYWDRIRKEKNYYEKINCYLLTHKPCFFIAFLLHVWSCQSRNASRCNGP